MSIRLTKRQIRSKIIFKLKTQEGKEQDRKSAIIKKRLFRTQAFKKAKVVMFYFAFGGEVKTQEMIKEAKTLGKVIALPVCRKNRMIEPCLWEEHVKLTRGPYGIFEPVSSRCIDARHIDLVVVPGLAFDKKGARLGRGKGYYDRFLKRLDSKTASIGLAFDFQILSRVPVTEQDVSVRKVISN